jgi:hypothetical protein
MKEGQEEEMKEEQTAVYKEQQKAPNVKQQKDINGGAKEGGGSRGVTAKTIQEE